MAQNPEVTGREILPIPDRPSKGKMALDARNAEFPAIKPLRPPEGAPNVVIVLIDDMGFGAPSVTGGPCNMPAMQKVADDGLLTFDLTPEDPEVTFEGDHAVTWDGTDELGVDVAAGVYMYRLAYEEYEETRKMILVR